MKRTAHFALATASIALSAMLSSSAAPAQKAATRVDIAAMPAGAAPPGFTFARTGGGAAGDWRVVDDPGATAKKAIGQLSKDTTDYRFPLAVYEAISAKNIDVSFRFKPVGGTVDQAGGIAFRLTTPDDYYVVRANALEDNVNFYRVVKGRRQEIKGFNTKVAGNQWHTLGVRAEGERFTVSFDGTQLFTVDDKTFAGPGKVALWTKADSITHFDTISITPLD
jgi:glycosyl hydrolase family 59 (putative galactocerebrosidase)